MSTKKQTNTVQTNTYDPGSMNAFRGFTGQLQGFTKQWLGGNPESTPGFGLNYQANLNNANAIAGRNLRNVTANAFALGGNPNSAATQAILARSARMGSGLQSNAFMNAYQNALSQQNFAAQMAGSYKPLQTGGTQNTTEQTSGLGTWLPQLAAAGIGAAASFMNPASAAGRMGGGMGGGFSGGGGGLFSNMGSALQNSLYSQGFNVGNPNATSFWSH